jgi:hypothetical protein
MATYYFRNAGTQWTDAANWSLTDGGGATGAVPTSSDDVILTNNSGNLVVSSGSTRRCNSLTCTTYTNTMTMSSTLTVSTFIVFGTGMSLIMNGPIGLEGNLTLGTGMTISGSSAISNSGTGTLTSNGVTWPNTFILGGTNQTFTLADNWTINGTLIESGNTVTLNNNGTTKTITCNGGLSIQNSTLSGTANIVMGGTGTISSSGTTLILRNNLIINTAGTITFGTTFSYDTGTFTYTSGTINSGTNTFNVRAATTFVFNAVGFTFNNFNPTANVTFSGTSGCNINSFQVKTTTSSITHTFQSSITYNIDTLSLAGAVGFPVEIRSSSLGVQSNIVLTNPSYNYILNVTDINSSLGAAGVAYGGTISNTNNWTSIVTIALYYIGNTNYSGTNLWSGASGGSPIPAITAPTSSDPVIFDTNSGNCIMNVAGVAGTVNFTNYTNTITFTNNLSVSGNITLGSGMTFAGAGRLRYADATNSTLTSNGKEVGVEFEFTCTANHTITFADNWTFGENLILQSSAGATAMIYNGNSLLCKKSLLTNNSSGRNLYGTTKIQMIGSGDIGTVIANLNFGLDLEINTVGSYTIRNLTWGYLGGRTLKYTTGTVTHATGTTLTLGINTNATNTLDLNGIDFQTITITGGSSPIYNLSSDLKCATLSNSSGTPFTVNGNTIYVTSYSGTGNTQTGTSLIYFNGWNGNGTFASGNFQLSATIDTPNTLTITDVTVLGGGSITHIQGNIVHTGTLTLQTCTLSFLPNVLLNTIARSSTVNTATFLSDITCRNFFITGNINIGTINTGYKLFVTENISLNITNGTLSGSPNISFIGSGTISMAFTTSQLAGEFEINTSGVVNLVGSLAFSGTFRHIKGTVISKGSTVILRTGATVLGASRMNLDNVQIAGGGTITMDEFFSGTPQVPTKVVSTTTANYTINFTDGFEKLAKNVRVSRCTIGRRGQLLLLSKGGFGVNNIGIRYYNQLPNGVSTDTQKFVNNNLAGMPPLRAVNMLVGDPVFT